MKIQTVLAREIFDSRGLPTLECELILDTGAHVLASVASGASKSQSEAFELRDGGDRLFGLGVLSAVDIIQTVIAPLLIGQEPHIVNMDSAMLQLDNTKNKSHLGANAMLAASIAICKANALSYDVELYEFIAQVCQVDTVSIPFGMFNIINGGMHANNSLFVQEIMIMPVGTNTFLQSMELAITVFQLLKEFLKKKGHSIAVGDEGGFAAAFTTEEEAFEAICTIIEKEQLQDTILLAVDCAASQFFDDQKQTYRIKNKECSYYEVVDLYDQWIKTYNLYAIEDGLSEKDWQGWKYMTKTLSESVQLIGDDIFATNVDLIIQGIEQKVAQAVIIKPNQIGTVTETLQAIQLCREYDLPVVISHRSGETNDSFIADLAVGCNALQIKAGGCCRGERMAKYNRLIMIEQQLLFG